MRLSTSGGLGHLGVGVMLLASCGDDRAPEPVANFELETEWLVVRGYDREREGICGGTLDWMDSYIGALAGHLDLSPTTIGTFQWHSQESWTHHGICPSGAGACTDLSDEGWTAFARSIPIEHEICHIVINYAHQRVCVDILGEGLAEYLGGSSSIPASPGASTIEETLAKSFTGSAMAAGDYQRARHFVSYLVFEFGLDDVLTLCAEAPRGITYAEFREITLTTLGINLEDVLSSYADYPMCNALQNRAKLWECSRAPTVQLGPGDQRLIEVDASCAHPEAVGPRGSSYFFSYQVRILAEGEYSWHFTPQPPPFDITGAELHVEQCASCGDGAVGFVDAWSANFIPVSRWLPVGDYTLEIKLPQEFAGHVSVEFSG